jgi:hypothetical protein
MDAIGNVVARRCDQNWTGPTGRHIVGARHKLLSTTVYNTWREALDAGDRIVRDAQAQKDG